MISGQILKNTGNYEHYLPITVHFVQLLLVNTIKYNCYYSPKLELRLTIINCHIVAKHLHTKLLRPSMPLTHLKVLFCNVVS